MAGTAAGDVLALNCSNGLTQQRTALPPSSGQRNSPPATAMAAASSLLYVSDGQGCVHTLACEMRDGVLQPLLPKARTVPNGGRGGPPIVSLVLLQFSATCQSPTLLASLGNGHACIYRYRLLHALLVYESTLL